MAAPSCLRLMLAMPIIVAATRSPSKCDDALKAMYAPRRMGAGERSVAPGRFVTNAFKRGGMQVAASVRPSQIASGVGLVVSTASAAGARIWQWDPSVGLSFGASLAECVAMVDALGLTAAEKQFVKSHGYGFYSRGNASAPGWRLANDMADFVNMQCPGPNLNMEVAEQPDVDFSFAARPLQAGEEVFENYVRATCRCAHITDL